ncbi:MAG: GGDEF domain-containing protein [Gammaproteobacteria bacterium]|nr:GGDEF domain-containing protein [Gammaproteobacteria bacterium]
MFTGFRFWRIHALAGNRSTHPGFNLSCINIVNLPSFVHLSAPQPGPDTNSADHCYQRHAMQYFFVSWTFLLEAIFSNNGSLVSTYPPISSILLPTILSMVIILQPRLVLKLALTAWLVIDVPVIMYLLYHPQQLWTPRGMDMLITMGPVMMIILILIPFQQGIEKKLMSMENEQQRILKISERDPLTGLYNRRVADTVLMNITYDALSPMGLIIFDIDHFKTINDSFGHLIGDTVLCEISQRCSKRLRNDDIFVRWGGEEFLVLLWGTDRSAVTKLAENLRHCICTQHIEPVGIVTASFGVTEFRDNDTSNSLLQRADKALYAAKTSGRDQSVFL